MPIAAAKALSPAALGLVYFLTAGVAIATFETNAPIWFANAVALVWLLQEDRSRWPACLGAVWVVDSLAVVLFGTGIAPLLALADVAEIFVAALLIRKIGGAAAALSSVSGLIRFIVICVTVPLGSAALGAGTLTLTDPVSFLAAFEQWYAAASLGLLIICPALLVWVTPELRPRLDRDAARRTAAIAGGLAILSAIIFSVESPPWLFVLFPALLLLVWSGGLAGASIGSAVVLTVGLGAVLSDADPISVLVYPQTDIASQVQAFQLYLVALALSSMPLAVVLTDQRRLSLELARVAAARSEFLAAMSHEIRTPMTGVLGIVDLLEAEEPTPRQRGYIENIRASGRHLLNIINDVLDFSRMETGKIELEHVDFSLPILLDRLRTVLEPMARERQIAFSCALPQGSPPVVKGDPTRLKQVLFNLVGNAIKFTPEGSVRLAVTYRRLVQSGSYRFRFEVRDTGIGIPTDKQAQLFSAFTQADHSTQRRFGGSGLGLAISKRLVDAMGGEIGVESASGQGSLFWFEIPLAEGDAMRTSAEKAQAGGPVTPRRLLLAEDVELNRDIIRTMLERDGHEVVTANDGLEAVNLASDFDFDMVLMDIHMPVMDGIEATRLIRDLYSGNPRTPILALTANVMVTEQQKCLEAGMDGVLMKPVEWDRLRAAIDHFTSKDAGSEGATPDGDESPFDEDVFARVSNLLPQAQLQAHFAAVEANVSALANAGLKDLQTLEAAAHKIVSQAGMLGLTRLSRRGSAVEQACRAGDGVRRALRRFREASSDVENYLRPRIKSAVRPARIG